MVQKVLVPSFAGLAMLAIGFASEASAQSVGDGDYVFTFLPNNGTEYEEVSVNNVDVQGRGVTNGSSFPGEVGANSITGRLRWRRILTGLVTSGADANAIAGVYLEFRAFNTVYIIGVYEELRTGTRGRFFAEKVLL